MNQKWLVHILQNLIGFEEVDLLENAEVKRMCLVLECAIMESKEHDD